MKTQKTILIAIFLASASCISYAQSTPEGPSSKGSGSEQLTNFQKASLEIEREKIALDRKKTWATTDAVVVSAVIGVLGYVIGMINTKLNYQQKQDELFFKSLDFLRGGSQSRNLGISAIQLYWNANRHRTLCVALLAGSGIFLLLASQQGSAAHEINNLKRIMDMLLENKKFSAEQKPSYEALRDALIAKQAVGHSGSLTLNTPLLEQWRAKCDAFIAKL